MIFWLTVSVSVPLSSSSFSSFQLSVLAIISVFAVPASLIAVLFLFYSGDSSVEDISATDTVYCMYIAKGDRFVSK